MGRTGDDAGIVEAFGDGEARLRTLLRLLEVTLGPENQGQAGQRATAGTVRRRSPARASAPIRATAGPPAGSSESASNGHGTGQPEGPVCITDSGKPG